MDNPRRHGPAPYRIALLHGGPGAGGEMATVAQRLAVRSGVLEPIQTAKSIDGQIAELDCQVTAHATLPLVMAGYSWGAWLGCLYASRFPQKVARLILISAGPFDPSYKDAIMSRRMARLNETEQREAGQILAALSSGSHQVSPDEFARLGALMSVADDYDPLPAAESATIEPDSSIFQAVWPEADRLRASGELLSRAALVRCPVTVMHGLQDPHPVDGVVAPLSRVIPQLKVIRLDHCGHTPWRERQACEQFFRALEQELFQ